MAKILLIDSDRTRCHILEQALERSQHTVVSTQRGDRGVTLAAAEIPDGIILDVDAQGLNGWQTIKLLKDSSTTWTIPVMAMAAPNISGEMLLQSGFDIYERKPVSAQFILKKINVLLNKSVVSPAASAVPAVPDSPHRTVVYINDTPDDSRTLEEIIQGAGYSYAAIANPLNVLSQLIDYSPKLIFVDVSLPVANGYELCAQIRRLEFLQDIPIVMIASQPRLIDRIRAKLVGAADLVSKPLRPQAILNVLMDNVIAE